MEIKQKTIDLGEFRISPSYTDAIDRLHELYPRAYDLRQSVEKPAPVFIDNYHGLIYEIKQDDEDHYPLYHYALFRNGEFLEIASHSEQAVSITHQGILFFEKESWSDRYKVIRKGIEGQYVQQAFVSEKYELYFKKLEDIVVAPYGFYVIGSSENGEKSIAFCLNEENAELIPISFPWWADMSTWKPADRDGIYFSDETCIYRLFHEDCSVARVHVVTDPQIRLGKEYIWRPSGMFEVFCIFEKGYRVENCIFSTGEKMPQGIDYEMKNRWVSVGDDFVSLFYNAAEEIQLFLHTRESENVWRKENLYQKKIGNKRTISLKPKDEKSFLLQIDSQWYDIHVSK